MCAAATVAAPPLCRFPQAMPSTRTTRAHMAAPQIATSANAAPKPTPIPGQSRPDDSVVTAGGSRIPSLTVPPDLPTIASRVCSQPSALLKRAGHTNHPTRGRRGTAFWICAARSRGESRAVRSRSHSLCVRPAFPPADMDAPRVENLRFRRADDEGPAPRWTIEPRPKEFGSCTYSALRE